MQAPNPPIDNDANAAPRDQHNGPPGRSYHDTGQTNRESHNPLVSMQDIQVLPAPNPASNPAAYLRSINAVRERSRLVFEKAKCHSLNHFDVDFTKFKDTATYVIAIIKVWKHDSIAKLSLIDLSETLKVGTLLYHHMAGGNTSRSESVRG